MKIGLPVVGRDNPKVAPEGIELSPALCIKNQLLERDIIAEVAHGVVGSAREEAPNVLVDIVRLHQAALLDIEDIREDTAKRLKAGQVGLALALTLWGEEIRVDRIGDKGRLSLHLPE